ncbi:MAG: 1-acyl-sn-glycerol-3-phosphate acyltransferase [Deltaproteobacteria bacterium]|nr:1-acyl-sn-glycerol-3-phosphate acyltransferase [Deltaproteobacteria bacterium]
MGVGAAIRRPLRVLGFATSTVGLYAAHEVHERSRPGVNRDRLLESYTRRWARVQLRLFGIHPEVVGDARAGANQGRLVVMNHRSAIDIGLSAALFPGSLVSRGDISGWPLLGAVARKARTIFVDRGDAQSGARVIREIRRELTAGRTVVIFPEGTTFLGDEVRPFHKGAFAAVARTGHLVLPVGVAYDGDDAHFFEETFGHHLMRMAARPRTRVAVHVGHPVVADRTLGTDALVKKLHEAVQAQVIDARLALRSSIPPPGR